MKKVLAILLFFICSFFANSQNISYKKENSINKVNRKLMLELFRTELKKQYKQEFKFIVKTFNVLPQYAWLMAEAVRKDDKKIVFPNDAEYDCCHVEVLFKKVNGKWKILESGSFSTDVWFDGIWDRYKLKRSFFIEE